MTTTIHGGGKIDNELFFSAKRDELHAMLVKACSRVPHYRDSWTFTCPPRTAFDYDLFASTVPILEKQDVGDDLLADLVTPGELSHEATSGTEGRPLICYKSPMERLQCAIDLWRQRRLWVPDLSPRDRFARFYAFRANGDSALTTNTVLYRDSDLLLPLFDLSPPRLTDIWQRILAFRPRWMHGPSTAIFTLAQHVRQAGLPRGSLELVELNGEFVPPTQQSLIEAVLGAPVANNYGCREFWTLGYTCPNGLMHVQDNSVFVESVTTPDGASNQLLVTSLRNTAWPLVRYRLGDTGTLVDARACGCPNQSGVALRLERGRRADIFTLGNGQTINAVVFSGVIRGLSTLAGRPLIHQFQVLKLAADLLDVRLCVDQDEPDPDQVIHRCDRELRAIIGPEITIRYTAVDHLLPDAGTGKVRDFVDATRPPGTGRPDSR